MEGVLDRPPRPPFGPVYNSEISINHAVIIRFFRTIGRGFTAIMDDIANAIPYGIGLSAIVLANTDNKKPPFGGHCITG